MFPDYIFESSWEVCNKVGGIYTVLSTRAKILQKRNLDHIIFLGPDCWGEKENPFFTEDIKLFPEWLSKTKEEGIKIKVGRWNIPGEPIAIIVDYQSYYVEKNNIYGRLWEQYKVDSLHAYGDYDDSAMFSYATAKVVESFYKFYLNDKQNVVFHANEWQTGFAALFLKTLLPQIATIFTTHATCIGRSIAGNNKPLYDYLSAYNGDQMARELNMESKHSIEKQTAWNVDCFTTVSDITARECKELLDKSVDIVLPNGFDNAFVSKGDEFKKKRDSARKRLIQIGSCLTGADFGDNPLIVSTGGRYEFRNKGIDVYIEALNRLKYDSRLKGRKVLAFIDVPGWMKEPRKDLCDRLATGKKYDTPLDTPELTHSLNNMDSDRVLEMMRSLNFHNADEGNVKIIFIPCYLTKNDGIINMDYYDVLSGNDLCIYPSYYEPWGYTPLEAIAFKVPCITTDLAGFGLWANKEKGNRSEISDGVEVIHRTDYNYSEVADAIKDTIIEYLNFSDSQVKESRHNAEQLSKKALWSKFITNYDDAYDFALNKAKERNK